MIGLKKPIGIVLICVVYNTYWFLKAYHDSFFIIIFFYNGMSKFLPGEALFISI